MLGLNIFGSSENVLEFEKRFGVKDFLGQIKLVVKNNKLFQILFEQTQYFAI